MQKKYARQLAGTSEPEVSTSSEKGRYSGKSAPHSSLDHLAKLAAVPARFVPALVTRCAIALARAAEDFDLRLAVMRWTTWYAGGSEVKPAPFPVVRSVKAQRLEELPSNTGLHLHVAAPSLVQVLSDDVKGTGGVPGVVDGEALARLGCQSYHLLLSLKINGPHVFVIDIIIT